jgi:hypothetical protein
MGGPVPDLLMGTVLVARPEIPVTAASMRGSGAADKCAAVTGRVMSAAIRNAGPTMATPRVGVRGPD